MKTYGGFLPIELNKKEHYYNSPNVIKLNSARYAILLAIKDKKCNKVYIPNYLCNTVQDTLLENGISTILYNIDDQFNPIISSEDLDSIKNDSCILIVNYFGIKKRSELNEFALKYKNVIFDNTQAFYCEPILDCYNAYSCRKFFGVADGAYLISNGLTSNFSIEKDFSSDAIYLMKSYEHGTNECYDSYLQYEEEICKKGIKKMSDLTDALLSTIDYDKVRKIRIANYKYLDSKLKSINKLHVSLDSDDVVPMIYPFVFDCDELRTKLIKNGIYISQWWKKCLYSEFTNDFERELSNYLFPLPIDQRYNEEDMEYISNFVLNICLKEGK